MNRDNDLLWAFLLGAFAFGLGFLWPILVFAKAEDGFSQGTLVAHDPVTVSRSELPRLSTNVEINVTGPIARARVTQHFANPSDQWTEALYAFPVPENAAVDTLHMIIGDRVVVGEIKEKGEARKVYEEAKTAGHQTPGIALAQTALGIKWRLLLGLLLVLLAGFFWVTLGRPKQVLQG